MPEVRRGTGFHERLKDSTVGPWYFFRVSLLKCKSIMFRNMFKVGFKGLLELEDSLCSQLRVV